MELNILVLLVLLPCCVLGQQLPQVTTSDLMTSQGRVHGRVTATPYGRVLSFLGIPYAQPPVGELRLRPPKPASNFSSVLNATRNGANCPQAPAHLAAAVATIPGFNSETSEDCLNLNVYVREGTFPGSKPVMVWIHGGGYTSGSGAIYEGTNLTALGNVVVVTINYRLGILGFYPNGRTESTLGLQDQIAALQWVQKYIHAYGGNPKEVTIFGQSAGSQSVSYLTFSPKAKGLFKRAISQSGTATSPFATQTRLEKMQAVETQAGQYGCSNQDVLNCVKKLSVQQILTLAGTFMPTPEVDNDVIIDDFASKPYLVHSGLEIIIGLNLNDGALGVSLACTAFYTKPCEVNQGLDLRSMAMASGLPVRNWDQVEHIANTYIAWYPGSGQAPSDRVSLRAASEFGTDLIYRVPTNQTATDMYRSNHNVYVYQFNSTSMAFPLPWRANWSPDANHGDEIPFIFGWVPTDAYNYNVSQQLIQRWTDFAKGIVPANWPVFTPARGEYLLIDDAHPAGVPRGPLIPYHKNAFWKNYVQYKRFPDAGPRTDGAVSVSRVTLVVLLVNTAAVWLISPK